MGIAVIAKIDLGGVRAKAPQLDEDCAGGGVILLLPELRSRPLSDSFARPALRRVPGLPCRYRLSCKARRGNLIRPPAACRDTVPLPARLPSGSRPSSKPPPQSKSHTATR